MTTMATLNQVSDEHGQAWTSETMLALLADYLDLFSDDNALRFYLESRCTNQDAVPSPCMTDQQYVAARGIMCPVCGSTEIEGSEVDVAGLTATQEIGCNDCNSTWYNMYVLIGYTNLDDCAPIEDDDES